MSKRILTEQINEQQLMFKEQATPATPPTGYVRIYAKLDGKIYRKDDTGTETALEGTGGGGSDPLDTFVIFTPTTNGQTYTASATSELIINDGAAFIGTVIDITACNTAGKKVAVINMSSKLITVFNSTNNQIVITLESQQNCLNISDGTRFYVLGTGVSEINNFVRSFLTIYQKLSQKGSSFGYAALNAYGHYKGNSIGQGISSPKNIILTVENNLGNSAGVLSHTEVFSGVIVSDSGTLTGVEQIIVNLADSNIRNDLYADNEASLIDLKSISAKIIPESIVNGTADIEINAEFNEATSGYIRLAVQFITN